MAVSSSTAKVFRSKRTATSCEEEMENVGTRGSEEERKLALAQLEEDIKRAEAGDKAKSRSLSRLFKRGDKFVKKDLVKAFYYFQKSFNKDEPDDVLDLGWYTLKGMGTKKDEKLGFQFIKKAYDKCARYDAAVDMGYCYFNGMGVEKNIKKALAFYTEAAQDGIGNAKAAFFLGKPFPKIESKRIEDRRREFLAQHTKEDIEMHCQLASFYKDQANEEDRIVAFEKFSLVAKTGDPKARQEQALCYLEGVGTQQNVAKARHLLEGLFKGGMKEAEFEIWRCDVCNAIEKKNIKELDKIIQILQENMDKEGAPMQTKDELIKALTARVTLGAEAQAKAEKEAESAKSELAQFKNSTEKEFTALKETHNITKEELAARIEEIEKLSNAMAALQKENTELSTSIPKDNKALAEKEQEARDLTHKVEELSTEIDGLKQANRHLADLNEKGTLDLAEKEKEIRELSGKAKTLFASRQKLYSDLRALRKEDKDLKNKLKENENKIHTLEKERQDIEKKLQESQQKVEKAEKLENAGKELALLRMLREQEKNTIQEKEKEIESLKKSAEEKSVTTTLLQFMKEFAELKKAPEKEVALAPASLVQNPQNLTTTPNVTLMAPYYTPNYCFPLPLTQPLQQPMAQIAQPPVVQQTPQTIQSVPVTQPTLTHQYPVQNNQPVTTYTFYPFNMANTTQPVSHPPTSTHVTTASPTAVTPPPPPIATPPVVNSAPTPPPLEQLVPPPQPTQPQPRAQIRLLPGGPFSSISQ